VRKIRPPSECKKPCSERLFSIFFVSPSLFPISYIKEILDALPFSLEGVEITLEGNPDHMAKEDFKALLEAGVNRLSLGVQSLESTLLLHLGRTHTEQRASQCVFDAADAGFKNISIDLMYDIPHLTLPLWEKTLKKAAELPITHLSLYNLTLEPGTPFGRKEKEIKKSLASEEESLLMYEKAQEILSEGGLLPYEIAAFAKEGFHSRHNTGYWLSRPFLGLGPSAFSFYNFERWQNIAQFQPYIDFVGQGVSPITFREKLSFDASLREILAIHLRLLEGIALADFEEKFGIIDGETKKILNSLSEQGFLHSEGGRIFLTKKGILFYDSVAEEIIL